MLAAYAMHTCNSCRGLARSLWVGVLIALPSGAGVALSVLGGNAGSLVGVAISASLLPPIVNAVSIHTTSWLIGPLLFLIFITSFELVFDELHKIYQ